MWVASLGAGHTIYWEDNLLGPDLLPYIALHAYVYIFEVHIFRRLASQATNIYFLRIMGLAWALYDTGLVLMEEVYISMPNETVKTV